ncbi:MAG: hypothetical protein ACQKBY_03120 [Verrucomicrobiales bacterium]
MNIGIQEGSAIELQVEEPAEWILLQALIRDAEGELADELGELMQEDELWEELVVPELSDYFSSQRKLVRDLIGRAHREAGGGQGNLLLDAENGGIWYAVLNQAQLALEARFQFGPREDVNEAALGEEAAQAFARRQFYGFLQELLLQHVMA